MMQRKHWKFCIAFCLTTAVCSTSAAKDAKQPETIRLWPGVAPGSEKWKQPETALGSRAMERLINVTTPTLTAYLPDPSTATGTAVIIAPGGGFVFLGMNSEGHDVAKWLVARGIAAFVLKYRTVQIEGQNEAQLNQSAGARCGAQLRDHALIAEDGKYGLADGIQAVKVVRAHAAEWGISQERIVFTGFSAGGMITEFTAILPDARPNYVAPIYGAPFPEVPPIPQGLPSSSWRWRKTTTSPDPRLPDSTTHLRRPDTNRSFTSITPAAMAGACANKVQRAIIGLTSSTTGWMRKD
jgi:acetyl esterase/lipase